RRPVMADAIGPRRGPRQLIPGESRRMNLNNDVVYRRLRLGPLHQLHTGRSRSLIRHDNRLHRSPPCVDKRLWFRLSISVTRNAAPRKARAAKSPPKPPPTMI